MNRLLMILLFLPTSASCQNSKKNNRDADAAYNGFWRCTKIATLQKQNERTRFSKEFEEKVKTDYLFQIQNDTMIFKSGCKIKFAYWRGRFNKTKYQAVEKTLAKDKFNFTIKDTIGFFVDVSSLKTMELPECENLKFGDIIVVNQSKLIFSNSK